MIETEIDPEMNVLETIELMVRAAMAKREIKCLDHGYVALDAVFGTDRTPARCARTSFRNSHEVRTPEQDARLTDYLIRNEHTTPLEFVQVRAYMKLPIFVARQWIRYRTASINEVSYRYVRAAREFYVPDAERCQRAPDNKKQGSSSELVDRPERCRALIADAGHRAFDAYETLLQEGLAPELARSVLPLGTYTEWYWQIDMHNLLRVLRQRSEPHLPEDKKHAQHEIRVYSDALLSLLQPLYPTIISSWLKKA